MEERNDFIRLSCFQLPTMDANQHFDRWPKDRRRLGQKMFRSRRGNCNHCTLGFVWSCVFYCLVLGLGESFILSSLASGNHPERVLSMVNAIIATGDDKERLHVQPRFTVGVIADIQYAPIPDGASYSGTPRFYKHSLEVARHAFEHFEEEKVELVVNLGDTIDGKCQDIEQHGGEPVPDGVDPGHYSLDHVMEALSPYKNGKVLHTYGNHCLYNLDRETLQEKLGIKFTKEPCGDLVGYYDHTHENVRFIVLDGYDIAIMQRCEISSQKRKEATQILRANNPNFDENMNSPEGLEGVDKRFVGFNGSIGPLQLEWLRNTLKEARKAHERVVILSHQPILPESSSAVCLIWNYDEVLEILRDHSDVVVASFCGHAHKGGYCRDEKSGIHFRVFEAALENRPERTYAMVDVYDDRLVVKGFGNCESAVYDFEHCHKAAPMAAQSKASKAQL